MYAFFEFKIKVRLRRSAWHGYQWCVRSTLWRLNKVHICICSNGHFLLLLLTGHWDFLSSFIGFVKINASKWLYLLRFRRHSKQEALRCLMFKHNWGTKWFQKTRPRGGSRIFLGGGPLVSCSTSTPINQIVFFFLQNTCCIRKPQVISSSNPVWVQMYEC